MKDEHMIHMANQIALYFTSYPQEEAVASVADHLLKFWEPRMRQQILQYVAGGGRGLHELVLAAVKRLPPAKPAVASQMAVRPSAP